MANKNLIHVTFRGSSFVNELRYDAERRTGMLTLNGSDVYRLSDLPVGVVTAWASAESAGVYYNSEVKGKFQHERASWTATR
jgi:hypothetical protein